MGVRVVPQRFEQRVNPYPGLLTEQVSQLHALGAVVALRPGPHAGRRHGEQLRADVHDAGEEALLAFQPALPAAHTVEGGTGQLAGGALDEAHVLGQLTV